MLLSGLTRVWSRLAVRDAVTMSSCMLCESGPGWPVHLSLASSSKPGANGVHGVDVNELRE